MAAAEPAPGDLVDGATELTLAAGERVTLMAEDGRIIRLDGPRSGPIADPPGAAKGSDWPDGLARVAGLVTGDRSRTHVLGATRKPDGAAGIAAQPDIWLLNTDSSGHRCIRPAHLELWRRDASDARSVRVRGERERLPKAVWPKGAHRMRLPARLARDGDRLVLSIDGKPRRFTLHVLADAVEAASPGAVLRRLVDRDCRRQALLLIDRLHAAGE